MSVITISSGIFCEKEPVIRKVLEKTGYKLFTDKDIVAEAGRISGMAENKIRNAFSSKTSVFNKFTYEKERTVAWLRLAIARLLSQDNLLIEGFAAHLIPREISHVLRICLIADMKFRIAGAEKALKSDEKGAVSLIHKQDENFTVWINTLFRVKDPINRHVLMLARLEDDLKSVANKVPGVSSVETRVGKGYHQADIYRKYDFEMPSKVLLVDDEREFVQTLSERLYMREMGAAVVYDGESALDMVRDDEPEVMILDLKMPGIDGIEVLRKVKETRPEIEVIILTGHGSDADRESCK